MSSETLKTIASALNADLKSLQSRHLYITAYFDGAHTVYPTKYPDRILVEGIKNLRSTGRFSDADRAAVNHIINRHCDGLNIKLITKDWGMHNAVITDK